MATNLVIRINQTDPSSPYSSQPTYYVTIDLVNDRLIWTAGSAAVYNHCGYSPTNSQLDEAATLITSTPVEVAYCFLDDVSSTDKLLQVIGASSGNYRYVFCFSFDGATATEPTLEAWDDITHSTATKHVLGAGTPANSMIKAVCTTDASPGASWTGTPLAASSKVNLNNAGGPLTAAKDLYANMYIKVPANYPTPETSQPIISVRYTYS